MKLRILLACLLVAPAFAQKPMPEQDCVLDALDPPARLLLAASTLGQPVDKPAVLQSAIADAHRTCGQTYNWTGAQQGAAQDIAVYFSLAEAFQSELVKAGVALGPLLDAFGKFDKAALNAVLNGGLARNPELKAKIMDVAEAAGVPEGSRETATKLLEAMLLHAEAQNAWKRLAP